LNERHWFDSFLSRILNPVFKGMVCFFIFIELTVLIDIHEYHNKNEF